MQLSYGLSTEYSDKPSQAKADVVDADQQIYAKYYVSQILQLGEEGIRDAWYKVSAFLAVGRSGPSRLHRTLFASTLRSSLIST